MPHTVGDPDLQIRGGGGEVIQTVRFLDHFGLKRRGEPAPPGTSPRSTTAIDRGVFAIAMIYHVGNYSAKNFKDKSEVLVISSSYRPRPPLSSVDICNETVSCSPSARNIGVIFDQNSSCVWCAVPDL